MKTQDSTLPHHKISLADGASNPFPGLRPFKIDESYLFFGREGQSDEVLLRLSKTRFVAIIGPSGSGKSSFIYCGVLPIIHGGFLAEAGADWEVIITRPGANPVDNMANALLSHDEAYLAADHEQRKIKRTIVSSLLRSSSLGLVEAILRYKKHVDKNYLILVDQFEELFRFRTNIYENKDSINETLAFINMLNDAVDYTGASIYVAITMRSDFIGDCAQFSELTSKINDSHYLIPQMTREQQRMAITGPVAVGGARISPRLVQQLLNDLGDKTDQLPILQHALMRTWNYWGKYKEQENEAIDIRHYEAIGTMAHALSLHANEAYDELDDHQKFVCEILFKAITEKRGDSDGIRRPTRLDIVAKIANVPIEDVVAVIETFRVPGRSLLTPEYGVQLDGDSIIDISHESLMRIWDKLKNWVDDEAGSVQQYLKLAEAAELYQIGKAGLWRPPDLLIALSWKQQHKPTLVWGQRHHLAFERTIDFLDYSKSEYDTEQRMKELQQKKALKRAKVFALTMSAAAIVCLGFVMWAIFEKTRSDAATIIAEDQRVLAEKNSEEAKKQSEIAKAQSERAQQALLEAQKSAEQARLAQEDAESKRLLAENASLEADKQRRIAEGHQKEAEKAKEEALSNEKRAEEAKENADKLRYLSLAKAMAIKSQQLNDFNLKGILAQQAYQFYKEYEGYDRDYDIYNGLYYALKAFDDESTHSLSGHEKAIRALASTQKGNYLYSGGSMGRVLRWDFIDQTKQADTLANIQENHVVRTLSGSPDLKYLIAGGEYSTNLNDKTYVELITLAEKGSSISQIDGFNAAVWSLEFSPDSKSFYALDNYGRSIKKSDLSIVEEVIKQEENERFSDILISSDGNHLVATTLGEIILYEINKNYEATVIYRNESNISAIDIDSENKLALGDVNGSLKLLPIYSPEEVMELIGHTSWITDVDFSNNNQFLASASKDKTVLLWSLNSLKEPPITLSDHPDWVWQISFTSNDDYLMAATQDKVIRTWPTNLDIMGNKICDKVDRNMSQEEWDLYVGEDLPYQKTCENLSAKE